MEIQRNDGHLYIDHQNECQQNNQIENQVNHQKMTFSMIRSCQIYLSSRLICFFLKENIITIEINLVECIKSYFVVMLRWERVR